MDSISEFSEFSEKMCKYLVVCKKVKCESFDCLVVLQ